MRKQELQNNITRVREKIDRAVREPAAAAPM